eukprot:TRINITY_DN6534_c0_g1_i1.p1 TRINITY_DN6534_c0_g1~~TRINITY_DN6534_c0_g1_i1.p1  ORF type:complete len:228 (+),score=40.13 TRINITY_DN6534_c0_g1_i1:37-684(+)
MSKAVLTYFNGRGLAEPTRLLLYYLGIDYEDKLFKTREDFLELRQSGVLLFGQVPLLQINGLNLVQSKAIIRYLAREYKLDGENSAEIVKCDMINDGIFDYRQKLSGLIFNKNYDDVSANWIPKYMPHFETLLKNNGGEHLVGKKLTYVDLVLFEALQWTVEEFPGSLDSYPLVKSFWEKVGSLEKVKSFLNSSKRFPKPDEAYLQYAKKILGQN